MKQRCYPLALDITSLLGLRAIFMVAPRAPVIIMAFIIIVDMGSRLSQDFPGAIRWAFGPLHMRFGLYTWYLRSEI